MKQNYDDWWGTDWSADDYVRDLLKGYREENAKLEAEILQLKKEIKRLKKKERNEMKEKEKRMRQGVATFFQFFEPAKYGNPALEQGIYRLFNESLDEGNRYQYPTEEGFFLFYPEQVLLGEGKFAPLFIVGEDATGRKTLLRYYPKKYFVGFSFTNEKFGLRDSAWFVGVERAKDEAMDLFFALPVDIMSQIKQEKNTKGGTIDDLLRDAEYRSQFDDYWTKR